MIPLQTAEGSACRLRVHIGPNNLVCFEAVGAPGQYLGMSYNGTACKPKKVTPDQVEAKFFVRVQVRYHRPLHRLTKLQSRTALHMTVSCSLTLLPPQRQMYQYLTTIMTEFGRPSVAVSSQ